MTAWAMGRAARALMLGSVLALGTPAAFHGSAHAQNSAPGTAQVPSQIPLGSGDATQVPPSVHPATLDRVAQTKTFRIGYRHFAPPYSYEATNGKPAGYIVDLCREVAGAVKRSLKLDTLKVDYVEITAENRFDAVRDGRIDVLCEPTSLTMSRRALVDFSLPTFLDGASVVTRDGIPPVKGLEQLAGKKVGVLKGTTTEETLRTTLDQMRVNANIVTVDDHPQGLNLLASGKLDAYFGDRGILHFLIRNTGFDGKLSLSDQYFTFETYALALPRGDQTFRLLVDSTLADLYRTDRIREIYARTFGTFPPDQFLNALFVINGVPR